MPKTATNNTARAVALCRELLDREGFPWVTVEISTRARRALGMAAFRHRDGHPVRIKLSEWLLERCPWEEIEETVRHEVAHIVAGKDANHGPRWQAAAIRLGAKPERCASSEAVLSRLPQAKWTGRCPCGQTWSRHRLASHLIRGSSCPACKGGIDWTRNH